MSVKVMFQNYTAENRDSCLSIFDENCPEYFSPGERSDYESFLNQAPEGYECCIVTGEIAAVYGLIGNGSERRRLNWIMIAPKFQGAGLGSVIIKRILEIAGQENIKVIDIAASHLSMRFFAKYGAVVVKESPDGWGPGMHRVDMDMNL